MSFREPAATDQPPAPDHDDVLNPGAIVTVHDADWFDESTDVLYVVIDGFNAPRYTIARLGGDGYQWPSMPRDNLTVVTPTRIVRIDHADAAGGYTAQ